MHKMSCHISDSPPTPEDDDIAWESTFPDDEFDDTLQPKRGNPMLLIGITGKAGSGKDTVGETLRDFYGVALTSFAWPIKKAISAMLGTPMELWADRKWKEKIHPATGRSPRFMAQTLGTEWGREIIDPEIWVDLALQRLYEAGWPRAAITDLRFDNEARVIREEGGVIIHVHRDDCGEVDNINHASEAGILPWGTDMFINNNGSLRDLGERTHEVMQQILKQHEKAA